MKLHGFKEVDGRIWSLLYLYKEPLDTKRITVKLGIAKSSTNIALSRLMAAGFIEEAGTCDIRSQLYRASVDIEALVLAIFSDMYNDLVTDLKKGLRTVKTLPTKQKSQLSSTGLKTLRELVRKDFRLLANES